jgi:hypothetical protein
MNMSTRKKYSRPSVKTVTPVTAPLLLVCTGQINCFSLGLSSEDPCCQPDTDTCINACPQ